MSGRELTKTEKKKISQLVTKECANYDPEYGCLPVDGECYMKTIGFTYSPLCRYFQQCVLPLDAEVMNIFFKKETETCRYCGNLFPKDGKAKYCSEACRTKAAKRSGRIRNQRYRNNRDKV